MVDLELTESDFDLTKCEYKQISLSIQSIKDKETGNYFNSFISLVSTYKRRRYQIPTASDLLALTNMN